MAISVNFSEHMVASVISNKNRISYLSDVLARGAHNETSPNSPVFKPATYRLRREIDKAETRIERFEIAKGHLRSNSLVHERISTLLSATRESVRESNVTGVANGSILRSLANFAPELSSIANTAYGNHFVLSGDRSDEPPLPTPGEVRMNIIEARFREEFQAFFGVGIEAANGALLTGNIVAQFFDYLDRNSFSPENWRSLWFEHSEPSVIDNEVPVVIVEPAANALRHLRMATAISVFAREISNLNISSEALESIRSYSEEVLSIAEKASIEKAASAATGASYVERQVLRSRDDKAHLSQQLYIVGDFDQFAVASEISELRGRLEASSVIIARLNEFYLAKYI